MNHFYAMKKFHLAIVTVVFTFLKAVAQSDSFDVFTYRSPELFTKSESSASVQLNLKNNDTSFCTIILYKSRASSANINKQINNGWDGYVLKQLAKADKKPQRILIAQMWDGWPSTLAIGNFYRGKKKCVVMLNLFSKDGRSAFVVYAFTDKSFKVPVEFFSKELHLKK